MMTVLIRATGSMEALAATLSALVPGVAEGLIGDAVVLAADPEDALAAVADAVGATLVVAPDLAWQTGAQHARRDWLLCLDAGDVPREGWIPVLERFVALSPPARRFGRLHRRQALHARILQAMRSLSGSTQVRAGDLVHRAVFTAAETQRPVRVAASIARDPAFG